MSYDCTDNQVRQQFGDRFIRDAERDEGNVAPLAVVDALTASPGSSANLSTVPRRQEDVEAVDLGVNGRKRERSPGRPARSTAPGSDPNATSAFSLYG
jgi:hypothetical protein